MIVGIYSSVPQSGKSTVTKYFIEEGFTKESFAESVKDSLYQVLANLGVKHPVEYLWGDMKSEVIPELGVTGGQLMSQYAMYMRNTFGEDIWLNTVKHRMGEMEYILNEGTDYVIDDMRFPNEFALMDVTIKVIRPDAVQNHGRDATSEGQLDNYEFDYIIVNDGTKEDLKEQVSNIYRWMTF